MSAQYSYEDCQNCTKGYSNLISYSQGKPGTTSAPMFGTIVIPSYGGVAYEMPGYFGTGGSGYFTLQGAYPKFTNTCSNSVGKLCN